MKELKNKGGNLFDEKSVAERLRDVTGNSENVSVLKSTSDRYGHSVSRVGLSLFEGEQRCTDILNRNDCNLQDCAVWMYELLAKLNPIIPILMASVQREHAFRVYNLATKKVEENLHVKFLENKPNVAGKRPTWLFDLDYLTDSMNYQPVTVENKVNKTAGPKEANHSACTQDKLVAGNSELDDESAQEHCVLPIWSSYTSTTKSSEVKFGGEKPIEDAGSKTNEEPEEQVDQVFLEELERLKRQEKDANDAVEALRMEFARNIEDLLLQVVAGKPVNISEASIRSALLFDDADGIDSLNNQAIFDAIQLMGSYDENQLLCVESAKSTQYRGSGDNLLGHTSSTIGSSHRFPGGRGALAALPGLVGRGLVAQGGQMVSGEDSMVL
ncbi:hypothetical protein Tco_0938009 [Tanacetum coccineum]|uniref:Uncharacterized protein n=1 Tax=Tanacetum coccineum TaxID=301880 RepID=A0ABQ5DM38_9ASTR